MTLAADAILEEFLVIGKPPRGAADGELETRIGEAAVVRSHTVIYAGTTIGSRFQCGHQVMIREHTEIGDDVSIGTGSVVEHHVTVKSGARLHSNVFVPEFSVLEEECWLGPNVVLTNAKYPRSPRAKAALVAPTIRPRAKIGAHSTQLPGVTAGEDSLVGARSAVVRDLPSGAVVAGNPAKIIKQIRDLPYGERGK